MHAPGDAVIARTTNHASGGAGQFTCELGGGVVNLAERDVRDEHVHVPLDEPFRITDLLGDSLAELVKAAA